MASFKGQLIIDVYGETHAVKSFQFLDHEKIEQSMFASVSRRLDTSVKSSMGFFLKSL